MTPSIFSVYLSNLDDTDLSHTRIQVALASAARAAGEPAPKGAWGEISPDHAFLLVEEEIAERGDDYSPGAVPTLPEGSDIKVAEPNGRIDDIDSRVALLEMNVQNALDRLDELEKAPS